MMHGAACLGKGGGDMWHMNMFGTVFEHREK